jgi:hypothetical protein
MTDDTTHQGMDRRRFLALVGAAGATAVAGPLTSAALMSPASATTAKWSDRSTWGGRVPRKGDVAIINRPVLLDINASVAGVRIRKGGQLIFAPGNSVRLESTGNVIVRGLLVMQPERNDVIHKLIFSSINERRFKGGGLDPIRSDVGLWVVGGGKLILVAAPRRRWNRTGADPSWLDTDELVVAPTAVGDYTGFSPFTKGSTVPRYRDDLPAAEVINLTSNVIIAGTEAGRAHVFIRNTVPVKHEIKHIVLRHMGPRKNGRRILGRWPLHFHHSMNRNAGTVVEGVLVRDAGSHAFVTHMSHGITLRDCVAYNVKETPFWWDDGDATNDALWDHCLAAKVTKPSKPDPTEPSLWGFALRKGRRNAIRDCTAVGLSSKVPESAGFVWPPAIDSGPEPWQFENCVAHNCSDMGSFSWLAESKTNSGTPVNELVVYSCRKRGIWHGSYGNGFQYNNCKVVGCANPSRLSDGSLIAPVAITAKSKGDPQQTWRSLVVEAEGADHCVALTSRPVETGPHPTLMIDAKLSGHKVAAITTTTHEQGHGWLFDFVRCLSNGNDLEPSDFHNMAALPPGSRIRAQRRNGTAYQIDHTGIALPILPFYT